MRAGWRETLRRDIGHLNFFLSLSLSTGLPVTGIKVPLMMTGEGSSFFIGDENHQDLVTEPESRVSGENTVAVARLDNFNGFLQLGVTRPVM